MGVGNATRKAVRDSIIAIIISNYFLSWLFFRHVSRREVLIRFETCRKAFGPKVVLDGLDIEITAARPSRSWARRASASR
jgi:hypothetical protein